MDSKRPLDVVIVGAGFAGLNAARALADREGISVIIADRNNYHLFQPLLYQVATAALSPADIAYPIRSVFRGNSNIKVRLEEVRSIDLKHHLARTDASELYYDYLVLAAGSESSYFGHEEWKEIAPGLKSIEDALDIRAKMLLAFERAENETSATRRKELLTFVIVGGGPTGVELAGAIREIALQTLPKDFRSIRTADARVIVVDAAPRLMPGLEERLSDAAARELRELGVELVLGKGVSELDAETVHAGDTLLRATNIFWTAGVRGNALGRSLGIEIEKDGRIRVENDCSLPGFPEVFVVGDLAGFHENHTEKPLPGIAPLAIQMGRFVGRLIAREAGDPQAPRPVFRYRDKGMIATIGRARAVGHVGKFPVTGTVAWILWAVVHIVSLIGFRNRVFVMLAWIWNYILFSKSARLITRRGPCV